MTETDIILRIYRGLISLKKGEGIPVHLRPAAVVGTVQDDPFDVGWKKLFRRPHPKISKSFTPAL